METFFCRKKWVHWDDCERTCSSSEGAHGTEMLDWETIAHHVHHKLHSFPHTRQDNFFTGGIQIGAGQYIWPNAPSTDPSSPSAYGRAVPVPSHSRTDTVTPNFWVPAFGEGYDDNEDRVIQLEYSMNGLLYAWQDLRKDEGSRNGCLCARVSNFNEDFGPCSNAHGFDQNDYVVTWVNVRYVAEWWVPTILPAYNKITWSVPISITNYFRNSQQFMYDYVLSNPSEFQQSTGAWESMKAYWQTPLWVGNHLAEGGVGYIFTDFSLTNNVYGGAEVDSLQRRRLRADLLDYFGRDGHRRRQLGASVSGPATRPRLGLCPHERRDSNGELVPDPVGWGTLFGPCLIWYSDEGSHKKGRRRLLDHEEFTEELQLARREHGEEESGYCPTCPWNTQLSEQDEHAIDMVVRYHEATQNSSFHVQESAGHNFTRLMLYALAKF